MVTAGYPSDLSDEEWALIKPHMPAAKGGGRPRTTDVRQVVDAILYLLRTVCQWRLLRRTFRLGARCGDIFDAGVLMEFGHGSTALSMPKLGKWQVESLVRAS